MDKVEQVLPTVDDTELDVDEDFADVREAVEPVAARWKDVGTVFHLKNSDLETIELAHPNNPRACISDVVATWLKKSYNFEKFGNPSWRKVVEAVGKSSGGGNPDHALKIAKDHGGEGASLPVSRPPISPADILECKPTLSQIRTLKYKDDQGEEYILRIMERFAVKWQEVGERLEVSDSQLLIIKSKEREDPVKCAGAMIQKWLESDGEVTWEAFIEALKDVELTGLAKELKDILQNIE